MLDIRQIYGNIWQEWRKIIIVVTARVRTKRDVFTHRFQFSVETLTTNIVASNSTHKQFRYMYVWKLSDS